MEFCHDVVSGNQNDTVPDNAKKCTISIVIFTKFMSVMDIQTDKHRQTCRIMTVNTTLAHKEPHSKNENTSSYKRKMPNCCKITVLWTITPHHNRFMALFQGPPRWASARRELLNFMVQGKIKRGRHTDHPAGHHSIQTNQCPPPPSTPFLQAGCPSCRPTNSVKALKALFYATQL